MEEFIQSYGVNYNSLQHLLKTTNSIIAGSSALYLYLKEHQIETSWEPNDLDIWIEHTDQIVVENEYYSQRGNMYLFANLLISSGYNLSREFEQRDQYEEQLNKIKHILSFVHPNGKKIQIIVIAEQFILDYIIKYFDLSICITWWNAFTETLDTFYPQLTLRKQCVIINNNISSRDRFEIRVEKYKQRGFEMTESPPLFNIQPDPRSFLSITSLKDKMAFDVWNYEDVECTSFLRKSYWNILIFISGQFQAFHRNDLITFMRTRSTLLPTIGYVYDTPNNQSITEYALGRISFSDYSIFELIQEYSVSHHHHQKTLYSLHCYTIQDWESKTPTLTTDIPFQDFLAPLPPPQDDSIVDLVQLINQELYPNGIPANWNIQEIEFVNLPQSPEVPIQNNNEDNPVNEPSEEEFQDILSLLLID
jgi:hypothetical protein